MRTLRNIFGKERNKVYRTMMLRGALEEIEVRATVLYRGKYYMIFKRQEDEPEDYSIAHVLVNGEELTLVPDIPEDNAHLCELGARLYEATERKKGDYAHFIWLEDEQKLEEEIPLLKTSRDAELTFWQKMIDFVMVCCALIWLIFQMIVTTLGNIKVLGITLEYSYFRIRLNGFDHIVDSTFMKILITVLYLVVILGVLYVTRKQDKWIRFFAVVTAILLLSAVSMMLVSEYTLPGNDIMGTRTVGWYHTLFHNTEISWYDITRLNIWEIMLEDGAIRANSIVCAIWRLFLMGYDLVWYGIGALAVPIILGFLSVYIDLLTHKK